MNYDQATEGPVNRADQQSNFSSSAAGRGVTAVHIHRWAFGVVLCAITAVWSGCGWSSYLDPTKTGYFQEQPTSMPILSRIDVIEEPEPYRRTTTVTREDLLPNDLTYRLAPGDAIAIEVFELEFPGQLTRRLARVDASGRVRLPVLGDIAVAGLTEQELQDLLYELVGEIHEFPQVSVQLEESGFFQYTVYGNIRGEGVYLLRRPDFRLLEAIARAGGTAPTTKTIYVIREVPLDDDMLAPYLREPHRPVPDPRRPRQPVDIEDLIDRLDDPDPNPATFGSAFGDRSQDGRSDPPPLIDIDDLEPVRVRPGVDDEQPEAVRPPPPVRPHARPSGMARNDDTRFIFDQERGEWVRVRIRSDEHGDVVTEDIAPDAAEMVMQRIIEIPYDELRKGDMRYNIVVRPNDRIFIDFPPMGVVYVEGEIARPGAFSLNPEGINTLSRLIATAGGLGPLAIPDRVTITRIVSDPGPGSPGGRQASIRVNLAAIRNGTDPDIILKPDDHIMIGTAFYATPLAVIRNGFRATYGFGFLLDRNFGNDVFGPPPASRITFN